MTDDPRRPVAAAHPEHDLLSIAALADRQGTDLAAPERRRAEALVADCTECADLYRDLKDLDEVLPTTSVPSRPRDFRLTAADARRLRPAGWRRWWRSIGSSRDTLTRPLALGLTTLGLVGLLLGSVPSFLSGSSGVSGSASGAAPADLTAGPEQRSADQAVPAASAAASAVPGYGATELDPASAAPAPRTGTIALPAYPDVTATDGGTFIGQDPDPSPAGSTAAAGAKIDPAEVGQAGSTVAPVIVLAGALLLAGLALFGLRWSGRRV